MSDEWEPIAKLNPGGRNLDEPILRSYRKPRHAMILSASVKARGLLGSSVVLLRRGDQLAIRPSTDADLPYMVRPVQRDGHIAATGVVSDAGMSFRLLPDGDVMLLEPIEG